MIAHRFFFLAVVAASITVVANADPRLRATAELASAEEVRENMTTRLDSVLLRKTHCFGLLSFPENTAPCLRYQILPCLANINISPLDGRGGCLGPKAW